ncbi:MAG: HlyD family type I secretion periplasmic adaptor subunit [Magnetococcales bacterium]|nr:HlyD family type I secretion periplasmic adaptor subunit [Magnetococcales bacterium]
MSIDPDNTDPDPDRTPPDPLADAGGVHVVEQPYERGQLIFREGDAGDCAYQVVTGQVELTIKSPEGPIRLAILGKGEIFGEMGVLDGLARNASALAMESVTLRVYSREAFYQLLRHRPESALSMIKMVTERLRQADESIVHPDHVVMAGQSPSPTGWWGRWFGGQSRRFRRVRLEYQPDAIEIEEQPIPMVARWIMFTLIMFLVVGMVWASLAHLDRVVSGQGKLVTRAAKIFIQPLETMIVRSIEVQVGQEVKAGQLLAQLDPTFAEAEAVSSQASMKSFAAQVQRLTAELDGENPTHFSTDQGEERLQRRLYASRQRERSDQLLVSESTIQELQARLRATREDQRAMQTDLAIVRELETMRRTLLEEGYGSRVLLLEAKRQLSETRRTSEHLLNSVEELGHKLAAAQAQRSAMMAEWRSQDGQELQTAQRELIKYAEVVAKHERMLMLVRLTAPIDAVVLDIAPRTTGSIIRQAEVLLTLVAVDSPLQAEVNIPARDIGYLRKGDRARVKLDAIPFQRHGTLEGAISTISEDIFEEELDGRKQPVYRARLTLKQNTLRELPKDFRLIPGMSAVAEIKVGTRSLLSYFFYPILRTLDSSLREP